MILITLITFQILLKDSVFPERIIIVISLLQIINSSLRNDNCSQEEMNKMFGFFLAFFGVMSLEPICPYFKVL